MRYADNPILSSRPPVVSPFDIRETPFACYHTLLLILFELAQELSRPYHAFWGECGTVDDGALGAHAGQHAVLAAEHRLGRLEGAQHCERHLLHKRQRMIEVMY